MSMQTHPVKIEKLLSPAELDSVPLRNRIWMTTSSLDGSRRVLLNKMNAAFCEYDGLIFTHDGRLWPIPEDIEAIFGEEGRWISLYLERDENGAPKRKVRETHKLAVLYLYFCIAMPEIAAKIIK